MDLKNSQLSLSNQEIAEVEETVKRKDLYQLVNVISQGFIKTVGVRAGHFEIDPSLTFNLVHFDVEDGFGVNPRVDDNQLFLDLWFHADKTEHPGVLQERLKDGRRLILLTVVITKIDYISTGSNRYYW